MMKCFQNREDRVKSMWPHQGRKGTKGERDNFRMHGVVRPEDTARENNSFLDGEMPEAGANGTGNIFTGRT